MATITTRPCMFCHETSTVEATEAEALAWLAGQPVQDVWPEMPRAEREQLISGTHPACWAGVFGPGDD